MKLYGCDDELLETWKKYNSFVFLLHYHKINDEGDKEGAHYVVVTVDFWKDFWWATVTGDNVYGSLPEKFGMRQCTTLQSSLDWVKDHTKFSKRKLAKHQYHPFQSGVHTNLWCLMMVNMMMVALVVPILAIFCSTFTTNLDGMTPKICPISDQNCCVYP